MKQTKTEAESLNENNHVHFFIHRDDFLAIEGPMPVFQTLEKEGKLWAHKETNCELQRPET